MPDDLSQLQSLLNYRFKDISLLETALTHPSHAKLNNSPNEQYQRLEFLGDAVLSLSLANTLFHTFPLEREGTLARYRAALAKGSSLTSLAKKLNLQLFIRTNPAEIPSPEDITPAILEDAFEAILGAIFLDSDFQTAQKHTLSYYGDIKTALIDLLNNDNPKGLLQETLRETLPDAQLSYQLVNEEGPPHQRTFTMSVSINDEICGTGSANSKKSAEEIAASQALKSIHKLLPNKDNS